MPRKTATVNVAESAPSVQEAENDLQAKREHYADLNARLGRGDSSVSLDDWREAGLAIEFHEKRLEGAKAVAAVQAEKDRRAAIFDLRKTARTRYAADTATITKDADKAKAAIRTLAESVIAHNRNIAATSATKQQLRPANLDKDARHPEDHLLRFPGLVDRTNAIDIVKAVVAAAVEGLTSAEAFGPVSGLDQWRSPGAEALKRIERASKALSDPDEGEGE